MKQNYTIVYEQTAEEITNIITICTAFTSIAITNSTISIAGTTHVCTSATITISSISITSTTNAVLVLVLPLLLVLLVLLVLLMLYLYLYYYYY